eukprot:273980-Pleurochrysis_carterae.AAC.3
MDLPCARCSSFPFCLTGAAEAEPQEISFSLQAKREGSMAATEGFMQSGQGGPRRGGPMGT